MNQQRRRTVLITGGSRGIGKELVRAFAQKDYNVAFCYKSDEDAAQALLNELLIKEVNAIKIKCDVSDFQAVGQMFAALKNHYGFIDTVVNNAGIAHRAIFTDETEADFDKVIGNNLKSVFNVCSHFSPNMISERFGRIINISSIWGVVGASMETLYSMSKAGVIGFTKALAKELALSGVTVNSIAAGYVDTDMNSDINEKDKQTFLNTVPMGRAANAIEIVPSVLFLADENNSYITGQVLGVNGGLV